MTTPERTGPIHHPWSPITDLPEDVSGMVQADLGHLAQVWSEQAVRLRGSPALTRFNDRLRREWAIETGIIEGLYSLDRGITQVLIERGIEASLIPHGTTDRPVSEIIPILRDQEATLEGLFDFVAQRRSLSTSYIKELHQQLTRTQEYTDGIDAFGNAVQIPLIHGDWKPQTNNPTRRDGTVHEYSPPEHVASEMDRLVALHSEHEANRIPPEVSAAWLHHRFTQIHPFQDGNGRVARAIASLVFLKAGWFPLVINRDQRDEYIDALEAADAGDLHPLATLISRVQKQAFIRALSLSEDALRQTEPLAHVIAQAADRMRQRRYAEVQDMQSQAIGLADNLVRLAEQRIQELCTQLIAQLREIDPGYRSSVKRSDESTDHYFKHQIVKTAQQLNYFADTRTYRAWVRLRIHEERETDVVVAFHGLGSRFVGIMAASAFLEYRDRNDGQTTTDGPYLVSEEVFQFAYSEPVDDLRLRFDQWMSRVALVSLDIWRRQL